MTASLFIPRSELMQSLGMIRKLCKPKRGEEAVLSFDGQCLHIELGGMGVTPAARGDWKGQARVGATFILGLAKAPPAGDVIEFRVEDGDLRIGTTILPCKWQPAWSRSIELPENPTDDQILALPLQHEMSEIISSGYENLLKDAEERRDEAVSKALKFIARFGVTHEELENLVIAAIQRRHSESGEQN